MAAVATAGVSRSELFEYAAELPYATSHYFVEINILARKMNTDYAEACQLVAERAKHGDVRALLLRMAGALSSGEDEAEFFRREAEVIGETYGNQYERDVEALKKWNDAYVTLLVASGLIVIVSIISMMIYEVGVAIIIALAMTMVLATCLGAWIIYASAPREIKTRISGPSSKLQLRGTKIFRVTAPLAFSACALMVLLGMDLGLVLIVGGLILLPAGFIINMDDKNVTKKDRDIPTVVRVLGGFTAALGTTVSEALTNIDRRSMGSMMPEITRLRYRIGAGLDPSLCWKAMVDETGSELIDRTVQIFWTSLRLGGDPSKVGTATAYYSSRIAFLRESRSMVASTFQWLTLPLHIAMVGLLQFILVIMQLFTTTINASSQALASPTNAPSSLHVDQIMTFGQVDLQLVEVLVVLVVLVLTGANAFAPKAAAGGHNLKIVYNLSIMMALSGLILLAVPIFANSIFKSIVEI